MIANSLESSIDEVLGYLRQNIVDISDYELGVIRSTIMSCHSQVASTKLLLTEDINGLLKVKSDLSYIMMKIRDTRIKLKADHDGKYNRLFTQLTRMGRPSKAAIDAEIYYNNSDLNDKSLRMSHLDSAYEFLSDQRGILDKVIQTMESRRYDLS